MCATIAGFPYRPDCRHFLGYKPCRFKRLCEDCPECSPMGKRLLIINLDAMGNVLLTTSLLAPLRRAYGDDAHITWITRANALPLLEHNPLLDRVIPYDLEGTMIVRAQKFDAAFNADKAANSCALLNEVTARHKFGFGLSDQGAIVPAAPESGYNFRMGLDDALKFRGNTRPATQILHECMGLEFRRDPYILEQTAEERAFIRDYRTAQGLDGKAVIGINTGCAPLYAHKRLTEAQYVDLARRLKERFPQAVVALVGGKAETAGNAAIAAAVHGVPSTPTDLGLRRGIGFEDLCDIVITGDTLGLHIAIALKKFVVAFFTITCPQEIDLYDRGVKVPCLFDCAPCWKRECADLKCIREMDLGRLVDGVAAYFK
ncbi:MAG: glycosyltransferase family 9 protein [Planctomycetota bacterium]